MNGATYGPPASMSVHVNNVYQYTRPNGTTTAYRNPKKQFIDFSRKLYPNDRVDVATSLVTEEKLFHFLWYTAYRKKVTTTRPCTTFNVDDYRQTLAVHGIQGGNGAIDPSNPPRPLLDQEYIGASHFGKFQAAVKDLCQEVLATNRVNAEEAARHLRSLDSPRIQMLNKQVTQRKKHIDDALDKEVVTPCDMPFANVDNIPRIEESMWTTLCRCLNNVQRCMMILQFRFFYLYTLHCLSRGACVWNSTLKLFHGIVRHDKEEFHSPMEIMMHRSHDKNSNSRAGNPTWYTISRHRDVKRCGQGAFALYMVYRFSVTDEAEYFDFLDNSSWFKTRLIVKEDCSHSTNKEPIRDRTYETFLKRICQALEIFSIKWEHFGRFFGVREMERKEVPSPLIIDLGKWRALLGGGNKDGNENKTAFKRHYSANMNFEAMRAAAGHPPTAAGHFVKRAEVKPSESLQRKLLPWIDTQLERVQPHKNKRFTAWSFLSLMKHMRIVFLQDVAAMMIEEDRNVHPIVEQFRDVFESQEFLDFRREMEQYFESAEAQANQTEVRLNECLPGQLGYQMYAFRQSQNAQLQSLRGVDLNQKLHQERTEQKLQQMHQEIRALSQNQQQFMQYATPAMHNVGVLAQTVRDGLNRSNLFVPVPSPPQWITNDWGSSYAKPIWPTLQQPSPVTLQPTPMRANTMPTGATITPSPAMARGMVMPNREAPQQPLRRAARAARPAHRLSVGQRESPSAFPVPNGKYQSLPDMVKDWLGTGTSKFADYGGLMGLEAEYGASWRSKMSDGANKAVTRLARIMKAVLKKKAQDQEMEGLTEAVALQRAITFFEGLVKEAAKKKRIEIQGPVLCTLGGLHKIVDAHIKAEVHHQQVEELHEQEAARQANRVAV